MKSRGLVNEGWNYTVLWTMQSASDSLGTISLMSQDRKILVGLGNPVDGLIWASAGW